MNVRHVIALAATVLYFCVIASAKEPETFTFAKADDEIVRHSEGSAVELKDGRLLLVWQEFRKGAKGDSDFYPARLVGKVSQDGGRTWSKPRHIETDPGRAFSNPGALFTSQGTLFVNYWTCRYEPSGAMVSYPIDLKTAIVDGKWLLALRQPHTPLQRGFTLRNSKEPQPCGSQ